MVTPNALAAAMTDALATKQDLRELATQMERRFARVDVRFETLGRHVAVRLPEMEKRIEIRFSEQNARFRGQLGEPRARIGGQFAEMKARFGGQLGEMSARFDSRLSELERGMTFRLGGMMVAAIGLFPRSSSCSSAGSAWSQSPALVGRLSQAT